MVTQVYPRKCLLVLVLFGVLAASCPPERSLFADEFSERDPIFAKLSAPMKAIADGKSFRSAIEDIAKQADINIWIDRQVDPTAPVFAGPLGPSVFAAIAGIAQQRDCVITPVENVLLVGRQDWVDQTSAQIINASKTPSPKIDVSWDAGTSANEATAIIAGKPIQVAPAFPHDIWPAVAWKNVSQVVAFSLVLAQFDRSGKFSAQAKSFTTTATKPAGRDSEVHGWEIS
jgi:hypothetical protein